MGVTHRVTKGLQVLAGERGEIQVTFYVDGVATNEATSTVTLTVTDENGDTLVNAQAATEDTTGVYSYVLGTTNTATVNRLIAAWTGTWEGTAQTFTTYHEVIGGFLFDANRVRNQVTPADPDAMTSTTIYPAWLIDQAHADICDHLEQWTGASWVPRYRRYLAAGSGGYEQELPNLRVNTILGVSIGGTAITTTNFTIGDDSRWLKRTNGTFTYPTTSDPLNVVVEYEHGYQDLRYGVTRIALVLLRDGLVASPIGDRTGSYNDELGTYSFRVTPGFAGAVSNIDEVNEWVKRQGARHMIGF